MQEYEVYDRSRVAHLRRSPAVTITARGLIAFSATALEAIGSPAAVVILISTKDRLIAFRPADPSDPNAYKISGKGNPINSASMLRQMGVDWSISRRYPLICDDGPPHIDVSKPGMPVTSNRRKKPSA